MVVCLCPQLYHCGEAHVVLKEFGTQIPQTTEIRVADSTADVRYLVLPLQPQGTQALTEAQLEALVTRDAMIGTAVPALLKS